MSRYTSFDVVGGWMTEGQHIALLMCDDCGLVLNDDPGAQEAHDRLHDLLEWAGLELVEADQ